MSYTRDELRVAEQRIRHVFAKIEILNQDLKVLDEIQGKVKDGDYDRTAEIGVRNTCSMTLQVDKEWIPSPNSPVWVNKLFRIYMGIKDNLTNEIVWSLIGTYVVVDPEIIIGEAGLYEMTIEGQDMAVLLNGDMGGDLRTKTIIQENGSIAEAITRVMIEEAKITKFSIDDDGYKIPYKLEFKLGDTVWDVVEEMTQLYLDFEAFFDKDGTFIFRKASNMYNDSIYYSMDGFNESTGFSSKFLYTDIRNQITVWGRTNEESGATPSYMFDLSDANSPDHPFTIEKLGEKVPRSITLEEDKYYTISQCKMRASYELNKRNNLNEVANIDCLPLYFLDVNKIIYLKDERYGVDGKYCIDSINCGLSFDGTMSISCHRVYAPRFISDTNSLDIIEASVDPKEIMDKNYDGVIDSADGYEAKREDKPLYVFPDYLRKQYPIPKAQTSTTIMGLNYKPGSHQTTAVPAKDLNVKDFPYWLHGKYMLEDIKDERVSFFVTIRQGQPADQPEITAWERIINRYYNYCIMPPAGSYLRYVFGSSIIHADSITGEEKNVYIPFKTGEFLGGTETYMLHKNGKFIRVNCVIKQGSTKFKNIREYYGSLREILDDGEIYNVSKDDPYAIMLGSIRKRISYKGYDHYCDYNTTSGYYRADDVGKQLIPIEFGYDKNGVPVKKSLLKYHKGSFPPELDMEGKIILNQVNFDLLKQNVSYSDAVMRLLRKEYLLFSQYDSRDVNKAITVYGFTVTDGGKLVDPDGNTLIRDLNMNWFTISPNKKAYGVDLWDYKFPTWSQRKNAFAMWNGKYKEYQNLSEVVQYKDLLNEGIAKW